MLITDAHGRPRSHELWAGVPYIVQRHFGKPINRLINAPGYRPYIAGKSLTHWSWKAFKPTPAEIVFTPEELAFAEPFRGLVMIEPNVKVIGHDNKAWPMVRWLELSMKRRDFVQCVTEPSQALPTHVLKVITPTFRHAAAVLSVCRAYVGPEGGLHHVAAAVGTPAVVLFGGFISPDVTGYKGHRNLFTGSGLGCGRRLNCDHCRKAMNAITVARVTEELSSLLEN